MFVFLYGVGDAATPANPDESFANAAWRGTATPPRCGEGCGDTLRRFDSLSAHRTEHRPVLERTFEPYEREAPFHHEPIFPEGATTVLMRNHGLFYCRGTSSRLQDRVVQPKHFCYTGEIEFTDQSILIMRWAMASGGQKKKKNPAAVSLGRLGGLKGGPARMAALTQEERSRLARKAINTRWRKLKASKSQRAAK